MPQEAVTADAKWTHDYIDHYRLDAKIIGEFLYQKWGNYQYDVKVCIRGFYLNKAT